MALSARSYRDRLNILPVVTDTRIVSIIGMKKLMDYVVSSMITAREYVNRVYPASIADAPIIM